MFNTWAVNIVKMSFGTWAHLETSSQWSRDGIKKDTASQYKRVCSIP
jgi:hypothetical protein